MKLLLLSRVSNFTSRYVAEREAFPNEISTDMRGAMLFAGKNRKMKYVDGGILHFLKNGILLPVFLSSS